MKITKEDLENLNACDEGIAEFNRLFPDGTPPEELMAKAKEVNPDWYVWLAGNSLDCAALADVNAKDNDGRTPLHYASANGYKEIAELLIAKGADVNAKNNYGNTPLHWAANNGRKAVAELLISKGADVNAKDNYGNTPLHWAKTKEIAELLISKGADVNAKDNDGRTPLHYAAANGHKEIAELLIAKGAKI